MQFHLPIAADLSQTALDCAANLLASDPGELTIIHGPRLTRVAAELARENMCAAREDRRIQGFQWYAQGDAGTVYSGAVA